MRCFFLCLSGLFCMAGYGQYYYNDIVANNQSNQQFKLIKQARIKKLKAVSFDPNGEVSQGFNIEQEVGTDFRKTVTATTLPDNTHSILTITYENNKVKRSVDANHQVETTNTFTYNDKGLLVNIVSNTIDTAVKIYSNEVHIWAYNANNQPLLLLKIKNKTDTTLIDFIYDEKGNIGEEHWKRKNKIFETYYYYYNVKNQITDVVRFNNRAKQLLPDFIYEYDDKNRVVKMTQITSGGSNYFAWDYIYNDKNLKQTEICYDKQKRLVGKIEYSYEYQ